MGNCHSEKELNLENFKPRKSESDFKNKLKPVSTEPTQSPSRSKKIDSPRKSRLKEITVSPQKKFSKRNSPVNVRKTSEKPTSFILNQGSKLETMNPDYPQKNYENFKTLKDYGDIKVYSVRSKVTKKNYIMKESKLNGNEYNNEEKNNFEMLTYLNYPLVPIIFESFKANNKFYCVVEDSNRGYLIDLIKQGYKFKEYQIGFIAYQLLRAVLCFNSNGVMHRNINPENILILDNEFDQEYFYVKINDFRKSKLYIKGVPESERVGKGYFIPPEVINGKYDERCDLWTIGIVLYVLIEGEPPFLGNSEEDTLNKILNEKVFFKQASQKARDLISKLLEKDYQNRISVKNALRNEWFTELNIIEKFRSKKAYIYELLNNLKRTPHSLKFEYSDKISRNAKFSKEYHKIVNVFFNIDKDQNGKINKQDIMEIYQISAENEKCPNAETIREIFEDFYAKKEMNINFNQFLQYCFPVEMILENYELIYNVMKFDFQTLNVYDINKIFHKKIGFNEKKLNQLLEEMKHKEEYNFEKEEMKKVLEILFKEPIN